MGKIKAEGKLEALITLEVKDKDGKTVSKITKPCKSFCIAFLQLIEANAWPTIGVAGVIDTGGNPVTVDDHASNLWTESPTTEDLWGIAVGTGTTPVANDDYTMETQIMDGAGAGQLNYGATSKVTTAVVAPNVDFQLIRTFTNSSGSTINVTEIGMISKATAIKYFLTLHEIVTLTAVANGQTLTVTITLRTTV